MNPVDRRTFIIASVTASLGCLVAGRARAQLQKVEEGEPKAVAVGYRHDSHTVDQARYPKHSPEQSCSNCLAFYPSDDEADEWGECDLMSDRRVNKTGWCSSYKHIKV